MGTLKGMDSSLVFAMIFAIIVIGLLLYFGFGQITNMFCFNGVAQTDKTVKDMESRVQSFYNLAEGASESFNVLLPSGALLCLLNTSNPGPNPQGYWMPETDQVPIIKSKVELKSANLWIIYGCGSDEPSYRIAHMAVVRPPGMGGTGSFCVKSGDKLYLENMGTFVGVSAG